MLDESKKLFKKAFIYSFVVQIFVSFITYLAFNSVFFERLGILSWGRSLAIALNPLLFSLNLSGVAPLGTASYLDEVTFFYWGPAIFLQYFPVILFLIFSKRSKRYGSKSFYYFVIFSFVFWVIAILSMNLIGLGV